ncbi:MAG: hypothetical protein ACI888_001179, partial [Flavobacteriales bacterium]
MIDYPHVPGRGLVKESTKKERVQFLNKAGFSLAHISKSEIPAESLVNN